MLAGVEKDAGASEEEEGGGAEVGDPAGEEDSWCGAASGESGVDADVVDGHQDHYGAADYVDGGDARGCGWGDYYGGGSNNGAHYSSRVGVDYIAGLAVLRGYRTMVRRRRTGKALGESN